MNITKDKTLRRSSPIILRMSVLRHCKAEFTFFLSGFSLTNIYNSQDNRGSGRLSISFYPFCHLHSLHRHLDISWVIAAES